MVLAFRLHGFYSMIYLIVLKRETLYTYGPNTARFPPHINARQKCAKVQLEVIMQRFHHFRSQL